MGLWGFLIFFGFFSANANADTNAQATSYCEAIAAQLLPVLAETAVRDYRQLMCTDNVKKLGLTLRREGVTLESTVVHIRHPGAPYIPVLPQAAKLNYRGVTYKKPRWTVHAILIVQGLVLDMDYSEEIQIVGLRTYLKKMWLESDLANYVIQSKNSVDYNGRDTNGLMDEILFPSTPAPEWVAAQTGEPCFNYDSVNGK